jgi:hypothetical protein
MANFKVGQRVKKVRTCLARARPNDRDTVPIGTEGTIVGADPDRHYEWMVDYDGIVPSLGRAHCYADSHMLGRGAALSLLSRPTPPLQPLGRKTRRILLRGVVGGNGNARRAWKALA